MDELKAQRMALELKDTQAALQSLVEQWNAQGRDVSAGELVFAARRKREEEAKGEERDPQSYV